MESLRHGFEEPGDEQDIRLVVDTIPTLAWSAAPDGSADFFNQRWLDYTGLSAKQALGSGWEVAIHPDDLPRILETFREALNSVKPYEVEGRFRRFDGEFRWFLFRGSPLRDRSGKVAKWYGTNTDLEERKRAEEALRKSEERWRSVFENSAIGVAVTDLNARYLATNNVYQTIVGYTEEELRALDFLSLTHEDYREANWALITELVEGKRRQFQIEKKYRRKDGSLVWVSNNVSLVPGTERVARFIMALSEDITQRKRAEEALQRSEGYLAEAQKLTHTGSWAAQVSQKENVYWSNVYWSKEMYQIFGLDPGPTPPSPMEVAQRLDPEYAPYHPRVVERAIRDGTDFEIDYRLLLPDGAAKYIHVVGHPVVNASGDVIELVGTAMDITERKRDEEKLRRSEADLLEAQRLSHTGSWKHDIASGRVTVSPEVYRIFGVGTDEVKSTTEFWLNRNHPEDAKRIQELFEQSEIQKTDYEANYRIVLPDGAVKHLHAIGHPIVNEKDDLVEFVGTVMDVTEHHRARADLEKAIEEIKRLKDQLQNENAVLREQIDQAFMFEEIVGTSSGLQGVLSRLMKVAPTDSSVLISGETGTGKELVARAIHKRSRRSQRAFVSVNCAALAPSLISSELFGHEKGAFTGAMQRRLGRFELANGGTIFLDEIGELPLDTQVALLRVLQEREFERVGGAQPVKIDVRVIAATNRDLEAAVANGTFRPDLYYRLNVFPIHIPPLRERQDDLLMLLEYFVNRFAQKMGKHFGKIDKRTVELFRSYPWPGNIRELQNVVERSVIVSSDDAFSVDAAWLSKDPRRVTSPKQPKPADTDEDARRERQIIEEALAGSRGRVSGPNGAAARLRVPPSTLEHRIKKLRIRKSHFKLS
jgi:PAS domain S-box-containing protein